MFLPRIMPCRRNLVGGSLSVLSPFSVCAHTCQLFCAFCGQTGRNSCSRRLGDAGFFKTRFRLGGWGGGVECSHRRMAVVCVVRRANAAAECHPISFRPGYWGETPAARFFRKWAVEKGSFKQ